MAGLAKPEQPWSGIGSEPQGVIDPGTKQGENGVGMAGDDTAEPIGIAFLDECFSIQGNGHLVLGDCVAFGGCIVIGVKGDGGNSSTSNGDRISGKGDFVEGDSKSSGGSRGDLVPNINALELGTLETNF
jgi:hypothetical protein